MSEPLVLVDRDDHAAILTLNRPAKKNAMNNALLDQFLAAVQAAAADDDVRAILLKSNQRGAERLTSSGGGWCGGHSPSSFIACSNSSSLGGAPWNAGLCSMKETPLPLTVSKIRQTGPPRWSSAHW